MNDLLLFILSIIGIFALYWVFMGQWRHNKLMKEVEIKRIAKEMGEKAKKKKK